MGTRSKCLIFSILVWLILLFSGLGTLLQSTMTTHVLIEIPLLVFIGFYQGQYFKQYNPEHLNYRGIPGVILVTFTALFWMIPLWLDTAVNNDLTNLLKYVTLTYLCGFPLGLSWGHLGFIIKGIVKIEFLTMLFRLGWIYTVSPIRLCNNYLVQDQKMLGNGFVLIGLLLSIWWLIPLFKVDGGLAHDS